MLISQIDKEVWCNGVVKDGHQKPLEIVWLDLKASVRIIHLWKVGHNIEYLNHECNNPCYWLYKHAKYEYSITYYSSFGKFFRSYSELLSKFGDISFQEYVFKGISHPVFYGDLVYKLRRVKNTPNFISSGSKIVKRLRRRQYDPLIIETTIGLVLGPCTALCRLFLKHCTLTNKAVGTIWRALSKPPQRRQGPDLRPLWLLVGTPSAIRPELAFSRAEHSLPYSDVTIYIFAILYLSSMPYV